jgi:transcriptional antiterminator NusG
MNDRSWYIIQTYSGFENSVRDDLLRRIETMGQQDYIFNVLIPEEEYIEEKKDHTKVVKKRKMFPSYVFVEMIVTEKSWFIVRNTPKVTGFLGSSGKGAKPVPLPPEEINAILRNIGLMEKPSYKFAVGKMIEVVGGPFVGGKFEIAGINEEKEEITVLIEMFGRYNPTEISFADAKIIEESNE